MSRRLRVLCLDIEGGFGGSSRSLFESLRHIDHAKVAPEIWCRRAGPVVARYENEKIPVRVAPGMPTISSLQDLSRNIYVYARFFLQDWRRSRQFRNELLAAAVSGEFDLFHCNHESLFLIANWLRARSRISITFHIRTNLYDTAWARYQVGMIARAANRLVFITENERDRFHDLLGAEACGTVIYNPAPLPAADIEPYELPEQGFRYKIACLSNYSWNRGIDRLIEIAEALMQRDRHDVYFVVAGNMSLPHSLSGLLGRIARRGGTLADYAEARGVAEMFEFLGHVDEPERVLAAADALIKPTRENNPWGRDIIEALAMARPVLTVGTWDRFVSQGVTGILQREFDASAMANEIAGLADNRDRSCAMGRAGRARVAELCDPRDRAADLAEIWRQVTANAA